MFACVCGHAAEQMLNSEGNLQESLLLLYELWRSNLGLQLSKWVSIFWVILLDSSNSILISSVDEQVCSGLNTVLSLPLDFKCTALIQDRICTVVCYFLALDYTNMPWILSNTDLIYFLDSSFPRKSLIHFYNSSIT